MNTIRMILWHALMALAYLVAFLHCAALAWVVGGILGIMIRHIV